MSSSINFTYHRPWGEARDHEAAKQLGLEGDHTIFMMGTECIDYIDDVRSVLDDLDGVAAADEVVDAILENMKTVKLPNGFCLVGMVPVGKQAPETYGIIDWRQVETAAKSTEKEVV